METGHPSTRAVNSGSGNRALRYRSHVAGCYAASPSQSFALECVTTTAVLYLPILFLFCIYYFCPCAIKHLITVINTTVVVIIIDYQFQSEFLKNNFRLQ